MKPDEKPPAKIDWWDLFLTIAIGATLTYFFYQPIFTSVKSSLKSLLPSDW